MCKNLFLLFHLILKWVWILIICFSKSHVVKGDCYCYCPGAWHLTIQASVFRHREWDHFELLNLFLFLISWRGGCNWEKRSVKDQRFPTRTGAAGKDVPTMLISLLAQYRPVTRDLRSTPSCSASGTWAQISSRTQPRERTGLGAIPG